jgi:hypothetical protein
MKQNGILIALFLVLLGCDDGNLTVDTINFDDVATQSCTTNNIIYKINDKEVLIIEIPKTSFGTEPTALNTPTIVPISATNRVFYRFYDATVTASSICETVAPITPIVTKQWTATSGNIQISTSAQKNTDGTKITGYKHSIVLKNITFAKENGSQLYETFNFGDYIVSATPLPFAFGTTIEKCSSNLLYKYNSAEALTLNIDPALLATSNLGTVKTALIGSTTNALTYRLYSGLLSANYFCNVVLPTTPAVAQEWFADAGVSGVSGIVEVTTTTNGASGFKHTIVLKNVILRKGNNFFTLGASYNYGELLTTN